MYAVPLTPVHARLRWVLCISNTTTERVRPPFQERRRRIHSQTSSVLSSPRRPLPIPLPHTALDVSLLVFHVNRRTRYTGDDEFHGSGGVEPGVSLSSPSSVSGVGSERMRTLCHERSVRVRLDCTPRRPAYRNPPLAQPTRAFPVVVCGNADPSSVPPAPCG
ncbi:hypothetical protein GALMADRAFT_260191 [Galerina marginata CBS 339.88]|uniref:Uncharacterized protein n=1 Tax=Galerina marginata (strain CBS 339.88) TaxID=685588 RepID=A0A067SFT5_GALM3|nr:hypothetical protein GALMADRAFT_260191 [Galerina marginata CBS 339.88]